MISIIISKYHPTQVDLLRKNIKDTIGVPFEMIVIENGSGEMGLCEVYNKGAQMARYDILCYAHEDIEIQSMDWGKKVIERFALDERLALLGLAGTAYKTWSPSGWWHPYASKETLFSNYVQSDRSRDKAYLQNSHVGNSQVQEVACIDGFWFCTLRRVALELRFDDQTFRGFHCYDIDYSLTVSSRYKVGVIYTILIKHFSEGSDFKAWVEETLKLFKKWGSRLPFDVVHLDQQQRRQEEIKAFDYFLYVMIEYEFPIRDVYNLLWPHRVLQVLGLRGFVMLNIKTGWRWVRRAFLPRRI